MDSYGYLYYPMKLYKNNYIRLKYGDWALEFSADISNLGINKIGDAKNGYEEIKTPVTLFSNGATGTLTRIINPMLGGFMVFTSDGFNARSNFTQMDLTTIKQVLDGVEKLSM